LVGGRLHDRRLHNFEYDGEVLQRRGNSNSDANTHGDGNCYSDGDCDGDSDSDSNRHGNCHSNTIGKSPYANAARSPDARSSPIELVVASLPAMPKLREGGCEARTWRA
jgi:hypothetical protein